MKHVKMCVPYEDAVIYILKSVTDVDAAGKLKKITYRN
jgi:hypothetical protein